MTAPEILRMATVGGADALHRPTWGTWRREMRADFFLFDPRHAKSTPLHDPISTLVYTGGEQNVVTTVVAGRVVLEDGKIVTANERELLERAQDAARAAGAAGGHQVVGTSLTRPYRVARSSSPARCRADWRGTSPRATRSVFRPWRRGGGRRPEDRVEEGAQVGLRAGVVDDAGPQHEPPRVVWVKNASPPGLDRLHDRLVQGVQGGRVVAEGGRSVAKQTTESPIGASISRSSDSSIISPSRPASALQPTTLRGPGRRGRPAAGSTRA